MTHDNGMFYLFDIGSKSIETSCSSSSAALEGEQSKDTSQNRNLSIVLVLEKVCHCSSGLYVLFKLVVSRTSASAMI